MIGQQTDEVNGEENGMKKLCDIAKRVYNPLNKLVRRIKRMRTTIQITVGMALLIASFNFFLASDNPNTTNGSLFIIVAIILAILSLMCWGDALNRAKKEENKTKVGESKGEQDRQDIKDLAQTLISEVKGLREDIKNRDKR